ncbi:MAG: FtsW/RodA/SpoVE family cell cycle protein [Firmicutes bacterium]|nr:FtsW/RodA/SpoVE family cell cycle protein [Bacillota bacterium]
MIFVRRQWRSFDFVLALLVLGFAVYGLFVIKSATAYDVRGLAKIYSNQRIFLASGAVLMFLAAFVDYHFITRFFIPIYVLGLLLLVFVLFRGKDETNTARWIAVGAMSIQPSEFMKIFLILFLAKFIDKWRDSVNNILMLALGLAIIAVPAALIFVQPALSACLVIATIGLCVLFVSGIHYRYIFAAALVLVPLAAVFLWDVQKAEPFLQKINVLGEYQVGRIKDYLHPVQNPDQYTQISRSLSHIGRGMLTGVGLGKGTYVPAGSNDFIFAVIGEQLGFLGCAATLGIMFLIIAKCVLTANMAVDLQGRLIASGVAVMLAFEAFVNVGVATALLPNTGMPFPFLSSGGSTMWVHMIAIGLVINVGLFKRKSLFQE